jgi:hypothetical protein
MPLSLVMTKRFEPRIDPLSTPWSRIMAEFDWDAEAVAMADYAKANMSEALRGATNWRQVGIACVFGCDDYKDVLTQNEVALFRQACDELEIPVLGFGVDFTEGYCWAFLVRLSAKYPDNGALNALVWDVHRKCAGTFSRMMLSVDPAKSDKGWSEYQAAKGVTDKHGIRPDHSEN